VSAQQAGLHGLAGVGKTALAVVLAHRSKDRYPEAQLYLNLRGADPERRPPLTPVEAMQRIIHCFHPEARLPSNSDQLLATYQSVLVQAGRALLLLDDAINADQVRPLLPPANCLLIVTSRTQLQLPNLATCNLDCLKPEKSWGLLLKLAPRIEGHEKEAAELCGHLPLALEVFAGAIGDKKLYPVTELIMRLRGRQEKLVPVDAAFQVSYDSLSEDLCRFWIMLSVFGGSFDLHAAETVWCLNNLSRFMLKNAIEPTTICDGPQRSQECNAPADINRARDIMQDLVNANLVEWTESSQRFRLHDLLLQFCHEKLSDTERSAAKFRHALHYLTICERSVQLYAKGGEDVVRGLKLFDCERAHIEMAFEFLSAETARWYDPAKKEAISGSSEIPEQLRYAATMLIMMVDATGHAAGLRFHPRQRIRWLESQCHAARVIQNRATEGSALADMGLAYAEGNETRKSIEVYEMALSILRAIGDRMSESLVLSNLGNAYADLGEPRNAIGFFEQALVIIRETDQRLQSLSEGIILNNLGLAYADLSETAKAIEFYEQALVIDRQTGDRRAEAHVLNNLGLARLYSGEPLKTIEFCGQSLVIKREIGDRRGEGNALMNMGKAYVALREARKAVVHLNKAWDVFQAIGDWRGAGKVLWNSALVLHDLGDRAEAIARAGVALRLLEKVEDPGASGIRAVLTKWLGE
jgi:tetratricopeptide (TPR) repeat protein